MSQDAERPGQRVAAPWSRPRVAPHHKGVPPRRSEGQGHVRDHRGVPFRRRAARREGPDAHPAEFDGILKVGRGRLQLGSEGHDTHGRMLGSSRRPARRRSRPPLKDPLEAGAARGPWRIPQPAIQRAAIRRRVFALEVIIGNFALEVFGPGVHSPAAQPTFVRPALRFHEESTSSTGMDGDE